MRRRMRPASFLSSAALALWAPAALADDVLASVGVLANGRGYHVCYLTNLGANPVRIRSHQLVATAGVLPLVFNNCPAALQPTKTCVIRTASSVAARVAFCRATLSRKADMRGRIEGRAADNAVTDSTPLE